MTNRPDEGRTVGLFIIGILCHMGGNIGTALGLCLQKRGHLDCQEQAEKLRGDGNADDLAQPYYKSKRWLTGLIVYLSSQILTALAFMFAAQSALAPLLPSTLVANSFFARSLLNEKITKYDIRGMVLIAIGAGLVVSGAPVVDPPSGDEHEHLDAVFIDYFIEPVFLVCGSLIGLFSFSTLALVSRRKQELRETPEIVSDKQLHVESVVLGHTMLSGVFSGLTVTFFRCTSLLLTDVISNNRPRILANYPFYLFAALAVLTGVLMMREINRALKYGDATITVAMNIAFSLLFQVALGQFYWQEWKRFEEAWWLVLFLSGIIFSLAAALYPTFARQRKRRRGSVSKNTDERESAGDARSPHLSGTHGALPGYCGMVDRQKVLGFELEAWPQFRIGGSLWPSGALLGQWLKEKQHLFPEGADYLELGAGVGLPSLVVAKHLRPGIVTVTDYADLVPLIQRNLELNFCDEETAAFATAQQEQAKVLHSASSGASTSLNKKISLGATSGAEHQQVDHTTTTLATSTRTQSLKITDQAGEGEEEKPVPLEEADGAPRGGGARVEGITLKTPTGADEQEHFPNDDVPNAAVSSSACSDAPFIEAKALDWGSTTEKAYPSGFTSGYDFLLGADIIYVEEQDPLISVLEAFFLNSPPKPENSTTGAGGAPSSAAATEVDPQRPFSSEAALLKMKAGPQAVAQKLFATQKIPNPFSKALLMSSSSSSAAAMLTNNSNYEQLQSEGGTASTKSGNKWLSALENKQSRPRCPVFVLAYRERSDADREYLEKKILPRFRRRAGFKYKIQKEDGYRPKMELLFNEKSSTPSGFTAAEEETTQLQRGPLPPSSADQQNYDLQQLRASVDKLIDALVTDTTTTTGGGTGTTEPNSSLPANNGNKNNYTAGAPTSSSIELSPEDILIQEAAEEHDREMGRTVGECEIYLLADFQKL
ncbi:unnamed protein product [Amoebophrya sp. A120]|nr:unnamed protein product [Amoebophrya sp. A120]|eukprot:GSA120T00000439001.1